jgi:mannose-1-phosphate guanylyltransferase/mannose-6-phosphate isomerase
MHHHRSEHWIVVKGTATVTIDDNVFDVPQGESTYIKATQKHRLENKTNNTLEIIEVQLGDYLEEDDIIRFDDDFDRLKYKIESIKNI